MKPEMRRLKEAVKAKTMTPQAALSVLVGEGRDVLDHACQTRTYRWLVNRASTGKG